LKRSRLNANAASAQRNTVPAAVTTPTIIEFANHRQNGG
jgi:hypothetical protein